MGGFAFSYIGGTESVVAATGASQIDFYRIDATRLLCVSWRSFSTDTWLFVVDHSDPVAVTFGAAVNVTDEEISDARPTLTQLTTDGDWLLCYSTGDYQRLTVSGTTVTVGAYLLGFGTFDFATWDPVTAWNHSLWEGHDADSPTIEVFPDGRGHLERLGIDYNHVLVPGSLAWNDGTGHDDPKWWVLDLSTSGVQPVAVFDTASGYYPNPIGAAQDGPGVGYWWTWDSWPAGDFPTGLELVLVETDGTSISTTQVSGYSFDSLLTWPVDNGNLNVADDGKWWLGVAANTMLESFWTPGAPWVYQTTIVRVDVTTASTLDYLGEADWSRQPSVLSRVWPFDTGRLCDENGLLSWQITDEHLRVENHGSFPYTEAAPHLFFPIRRAGLSHGRMVYTYTRSGTLYAAVYKEIGLQPQIDFTVDNDTVNVGDPITFDAENFTTGHDSREQTRDSYWHPIDEYRWEWDDGTTDTYTSSNPTVHSYARGSATHAAGSQTADATVTFPSQIGDIGYYLPVLRAHNSVGWSYASGNWEIEVAGPSSTPPLRQAQRDDGKAGGTPRANQSRSILSTNRARSSSYL